MFSIILPFFAQNASKNAKFRSLHEVTKCTFFKALFGSIFKITVALPVFEIKSVFVEAVFWLAEPRQKLSEVGGGGRLFFLYYFFLLHPRVMIFILGEAT